VIPACAYLFVVIETVFHNRFRAYYMALHTGASLAELEGLAAELRVEVGRTLRGTAIVQACVSLVCVPAAPLVVSALGLPGDGTMLRWLLIGAGLQVIAVSTTLLLYYFDFRREAFLAAVTQLSANLVLTAAIGAPSIWTGVGYAVACALTCAVAIGLLFRRMEGLLERTFQSQPYASEDFAVDGARSDAMRLHA
jgi:polysaccharide biosynthesis protein PelG